jgi:hypothetical protein
MLNLQIIKVTEKRFNYKWPLFPLLEHMFYYKIVMGNIQIISNDIFIHQDDWEENK